MYNLRLPCSVLCYTDTSIRTSYIQVVIIIIIIIIIILDGEESFLKANRFAAKQEITRVLWNPEVHYCTHKRPPPVSILGQPNPVHAATMCCNVDS